jgi:hypothetical protein
MDNKEIKTFYHYAWQETSGSISSIIQSGEYNVFYFYWHFEYDFALEEEAMEYVNKNLIKINIVTCASDVNQIIEHISSRGIDKNLLTVESWPGYWFMRSHFNMINEDNKLYKNSKDDFPSTFLYPFLSFNGRTRDHRSYLIDQLAKREYLDKGIVTYHKLFEPDGGFEWKHHDGSILVSNDDFTTNFSSYSFNEKFIESFLHIPTETDANIKLISEKTAIPILCGLPVLILGAKGIHQQLKDMGFELYTEIFDYTFDTVDDLDTRVELILKNLDFIINNFHRIDELYKLIEHKVKKNAIHARKFFESWETIPDLIKDRYEQILSWNTDLISDHDFDLIQKFKEIKDKEISEISFNPRPSTFRYDYWHEFDFDKIADEVELYKPINVVLFGENEWCPWVTPNFANIVNKYDINVTIITGSPHSAWHNENTKSLGINNIKIEHWPTYWFYYIEKVLNYKNKNFNKNLTIPFSCMNNRGHLHRCMVIDQMEKYNLIKKGAVTWINPLNENKNFPWKYFKNKQLLWNDNMSTAQDSFIIADEYKNSFFDFVTECCTETVMISEKTIRPLLLKKPFAVLGAPGFHKFLKELGFELYTELINYEFDEIEDLEKRTDIYVRNIQRVANIKDLEKFYKILEPKILRNYSRAIELSKDKSYIPNEVAAVINMIPGNPDVPNIPWLRKYADFV